MVIENMCHSLIANEVLEVDMWLSFRLNDNLWPIITAQYLYGLPSFFICEDSLTQYISWYDNMEILWFVTFLFHSVDIELCHKLWHILSMLHIDKVYWVVSIFERMNRIHKGVGKLFLVKDRLLAKMTVTCQLPNTSFAINEWHIFSITVKSSF